MRQHGDRVYVINNGHIVEALTAQAVCEKPEVLHRHLGVLHAARDGGA